MSYEDSLYECCFVLFIIPLPCGLNYDDEYTHEVHERGERLRKPFLPTLTIIEREVLHSQLEGQQEGHDQVGVLHPLHEEVDKLLVFSMEPVVH